MALGYELWVVGRCSGGFSVKNFTHPGQYKGIQFSNILPPDAQLVRERFFKHYSILWQILQTPNGFGVAQI